MRFNPPPHWPVPSSGWAPPPGWAPDPAWPPAPPGWQFFVDDQVPAEEPGYRRWRVIAVAVAAVCALTGAGAYTYHRVNQPAVVVLKPVDAQGNIRSGWIEDTSRSSAQTDCSFGGASPYDTGSTVRFCGGTADSADACWPGPDTGHLLCVSDPFSKIVYLVGVEGLSTARKPLAGAPRPFALVLDDGTQCRARIGGAWGYPKEHPDWVGHFACTSADPIRKDEFLAIWAPPNPDEETDNAIDKAFGGWMVNVGTEDDPFTTHKVTKVYYVG